MKQSKHHFYLSGREARRRGPLVVGSTDKLTYTDLEKIGIGGINAMDTALTGPAIHSGGIVNRYLLQTWLPGVIRQATQVKLIDEIAGVLNAGNWHDEEIVQRTAGPVGKAELYGDHSNIPLANYLGGMEARQVVRFEQGFQVGRLEEARQNAEGFQAAEEKRNAAIESLDESRNYIGFYGFAATNSRTFGLLNDPNLPAYSAATADWLTATFAQLTGDFDGMFAEIEGASGGLIRDDTRITFLLPLGYRSVLSRANTTALGQTFREWINENYPNNRVIFVPELVGANGGLDVAYLYADAVDDGSSADNASIVQVVPTRYQVLGSENRVKGYIEDATNATAGVFVLRPWAFARRTISS